MGRASFRRGKWQMATGKVCRGKGQMTPVKWQRETVSVYGKGKGFVTPRQRNSGQMARAKESSGLRQGKLFRRFQGKFFRSRHGKVCFRSVRSSGHTACDGKGKLLRARARKTLRRSTARERFRPRQGKLSDGKGNSGQMARAKESSGSPAANSSGHGKESLLLFPIRPVQRSHGM